MPEDQFSRSHAAFEQSLLTWCTELPKPVSEAHNQSSVWYSDTAKRPPLGHMRGATTKALWNGKAYEIVPIMDHPQMLDLSSCRREVVAEHMSHKSCGCVTSGCAHAPSIPGHIVFAQELEPDPAQKAIGEFIAVRKAKREAPPPAPVGHCPDTERALDRAMKKGTT